MTKFVVLTGLFLFLPSYAAGQPYAWVIDSPYTYPTAALRVINLAGSTEVASHDLPGIQKNDGTLTADGQHYLLATQYGVGRFSTVTRAFEGVFGPAVETFKIWASPSGRWIYTLGKPDFTLRMFDAATGTLISERCCAQVDLAFAPDGTVRYEIEPRRNEGVTIVRAMTDEPDHQLRWQQTIAGAISGNTPTRVAAAPTTLALGVTDAVSMLDAATGDEVARISREGLIGVLCCHENAFIVSAVRATATGYPGELTWTIDEVDPTTFALTRIQQRTSDASASPGPTFLSAGGSVAYQASYSSSLHFSGGRRYANLLTIDLTTGTTYPGGDLGYEQDGFIHDIDVERGEQCFFDPPDPIAVPPEGGIVEVNIAPIRACDSWLSFSNDSYGTHVLTPGPHTGAATIRIATHPTSASQTQLLSVRIGAQGLRLDQAPGVPRPPSIRHTVADGRVTVSWIITPGAAPLNFVVHGGVLGGSLSPIATVGAATRAWTSPPLPPGSYVVEVTARNGAGASAASNRVAFSIGVAAIAGAPTNLQAVVKDDSVLLTWDTPSGVPPPAGYVIEAGPDGGAGFAPFAQVEATSFAAVGLPSGSWQIRVRARTDGGDSAPSNIVRITTAACASAPTAPLGLQVMTAGGVTTFAWHAPATGSAETYVIEGGTQSGVMNLGRAEVGGTTLALELRLASAVYYVRMRARNQCGESAPSNEVVVLVP